MTGPDTATIYSARTFDAVPQQLFRAWTDPAHLAQWWGPAGFTNTFDVCEVRPGGSWRFTMHGPNGAAYPNESVFEEVVPAERIVFRHLSKPQFTTTATFTPAGEGRARMAWAMRFPTPEDCARLRSLVTGANEENFDRLAAYLPRITGY